MKHKRIWIVTVDCGVLRVFEQAVPGAALTELDQLAMGAAAPAKPRQRAPRTHDRMGPARHAIEKRTAPHVAAENEFLELAAKQLETWLQRGAFDELFLCAHARAAGVLKAHLSAPLAKRLRELVVKDLTHENAREIAQRLEAGFAPRPATSKRPP